MSANKFFLILIIILHLFCLSYFHFIPFQKNETIFQYLKNACHFSTLQVLNKQKNLSFQSRQLIIVIENFKLTTKVPTISITKFLKTNKCSHLHITHFNYLTKMNFFNELIKSSIKLQIIFNYYFFEKLKKFSLNILISELSNFFYKCQFKNNKLCYPIIVILNNHLNKKIVNHIEQWVNRQTITNYSHEQFQAIIISREINNENTQTNQILIFINPKLDGCFRLEKQVFIPKTPVDFSRLNEIASKCNFCGATLNISVNHVKQFK